MEENLKNNLKKCSRCAICAEACPIFDVCKSEVSLTRGKFTQLLGVLKKELKYSKKIKKNLSLCLNCGRCFDYCPSDIDAVSVFSEIKYQNLTRLDKFLTSEFFFKLKFLPFNLFKKQYKEKEGEIHFFGCVSKYKNDFKCCALPFITQGRLDLYEKYMTHNIKIAKNKDIKKIIFHCATCYNTFKNYEMPDFIKDKIVFEPDFKIPNEPFTYHKPCHMPKEVFEELDKKLRQNENYIPLKKQNCCGFGGTFFIHHPLIAFKIMLKLAREIKALNVKHTLTSCPVCRFGLFIGRIINECIDVLN